MSFKLPGEFLNFSQIWVRWIIFDFNFLGYYIDAKNQCCCQINDFEAPKAGMWKFKNKMLSIEIWLNIFLRCRL